MVRKPDDKTLELLKKHIWFLRTRFNPEMIILFGSRARGDHLEDSDIDLLVVAKSFEGVPFFDRLRLAYGMWDKKEDLEQICYTPQEFDDMRKRIGIVRQAVKEGIQL
jgi:predicted nucleotidyltransferase